MTKAVHTTMVALLLGSVPAGSRAADPVRDPHSFANPEHVRVRHLDLDLAIDFAARVIRGTATLQVERTSAERDRPLVLDTRGLAITGTEATTDGTTFRPVRHELGKNDPILGQPLTIPLPAGTNAVRVAYATGPKAAALQWLSPAQTAGKKHPLLFTQSQAIDARSWVPVQDTPGVRFTYTARVRTPRELLAVMSAGNDPDQARTGDYRFEMDRPIPSYLLALAVGNLTFQKLGPRTGVYAEPPLLERAAHEFADLEEFLKACERLYGPYRWGRYDVLVMPPSFPFGGMENPRLTFASPTVLAGDRSLVSLLAHELAHSWSGNLVSNATWGDFWLNEGFTVYLERRILEAVYGQARAEAEAMLGRRSLDREMAHLPRADQVLAVELTGRSPIEGLTDIPYEKGALFLRHLETVYGRDTFDRFLADYFAHFAFRSITTKDFERYLKEHLLKKDEKRAAAAKVAEWLYQPGLPAGAPDPASPSLRRVEDRARGFAAGTLTADQLEARTWTAQEWVHFLTSLPRETGREKLAALDAAHALTRTGNAEVLFQWLMLAVHNGYAPADERLERFLTEQGRRKFLEPIYREFARTPAGKERARAIYAKARPTYHPVSVDTVDAILGWEKDR